MSLNHSCTLRRKSWTLPGLNKFITPYHLHNQMAPISLRSVFAPFPPAYMQKIADTPHWTPISRLHALNLDPLPGPSKLMSLPFVGTVTWLNSSVLIIIFIVVIIVFVGFRIARKYRRFPTFPRRKPPSAPKNFEMEQRPTPSPENQNNVLRLPVYPSLGTDQST